MIETAADHYSADYNAAILERLGTPSATPCTWKPPIWPPSTPGWKRRGRRIVDPLARRPWGQDEFTVEDHEGNWLTFWEKPAD